MKTIASLILGCAWLLTTPTPASAECFGPTDPWPSFRAAVPTAARIIAGEVLPPVSANDSTGYRAVFTLRVVDVLRGPAPAQPVVEIVGLRSGLPLTICASSTATLLSGDMVVFALNAIAPDGVTQINTLAYLREPAESILIDVERITPAELEAIARPSLSTQSQPPIGALLAMAGDLVVVGIGAALLRRRSPPNRLVGGVHVDARSRLSNAAPEGIWRVDSETGIRGSRGTLRWTLDQAKHVALSCSTIASWSWTSSS